MIREQYKETCSAYRLLMREIRAGHNRRFKLRRQAEKRLREAPKDIFKAAERAYNLHQNWVYRDGYYVPCLAVYGFVRAMLVTGKAKTVREMLERGMITRT